MLASCTGFLFLTYYYSTLRSNSRYTKVSYAMAQTGFFHHVGTFLIFAAFVLLLVTSISSPVINDLSLLKVKLTNGTNNHESSVRFGSWGYCILNAGS